jgi:hypothetical protein
LGAKSYGTSINWPKKGSMLRLLHAAYAFGKDAVRSADHSDRPSGKG